MATLFATQKERGILFISQSKKDEIFKVLEKLCYVDNPQVALKACVEILDRSEEKPINKSFKWLVEGENGK